MRWTEVRFHNTVGTEPETRRGLGAAASKEHSNLRHQSMLLGFAFGLIEFRPEQGGTSLASLWGGFWIGSAEEGDSLWMDWDLRQHKRGGQLRTAPTSLWFLTADAVTSAARDTLWAMANPSFSEGFFLFKSERLIYNPHFVLLYSFYFHLHVIWKWKY